MARDAEIDGEGARCPLRAAYSIPAMARVRRWQPSGKKARVDSHAEGVREPAGAPVDLLVRYARFLQPISHTCGPTRQRVKRVYGKDLNRWKMGWGVVLCWIWNSVAGESQAAGGVT